MILVVLAAHRKRDPVAGRGDDRGRPQLDVELGDLARLERLLLVVRVIGPVGQGQLLVSFRCEARSQPS